jgi:hypothetical protein
MSRDHRKINRAALCHFADRTRTATFGQTTQQFQPGRITEPLEELRLQQTIDWPGTACRRFRRQRQSIAYLRHNASIEPIDRPVKPRDSTGGDRESGRIPYRLVQEAERKQEAGDFRSRSGPAGLPTSYGANEKKRNSSGVKVGSTRWRSSRLPRFPLSSYACRRNRRVAGGGGHAVLMFGTV